ncbi:hypothetical protein B9Z55_011888 [Caenorhabditis nigoni]|nr:hypothetical protein B9Z55_011888 [Caenorhabditis nigoni]
MRRRRSVTFMKCFLNRALLIFQCFLHSSFSIYAFCEKTPIKMIEKMLIKFFKKSTVLKEHFQKTLHKRNTLSSSHFGFKTVLLRTFRIRIKLYFIAFRFRNCSEQ